MIFVRLTEGATNTKPVMVSGSASLHGQGAPLADRHGSYFSCFLVGLVVRGLGALAIICLITSASSFR
jgi:hypothetical protein